MRKQKVYISGALTRVEEPEELKGFYEEIGGVCRSVGLTPYIPHQHTDPIADPDISPEEVYERDRIEVQNSDLLIAYVGIPSLGVGSELEMAKESGVPIILLYEEDRPVSRVARGNPAIVAQVCFETFEEALDILKGTLARLGFGTSRPAPLYDPIVDRGRMPGGVPRNV